MVVTSAAAGEQPARAKQPGRMVELLDDLEGGLFVLSTDSGELGAIYDHSEPRGCRPGDHGIQYPASGIQRVVSYLP
jgi:hypothetical protein